MGWIAVCFRDDAESSVPADTVLPHITYSDVTAALDWLARTLGFAEHYRYGESGRPVSGAQMYLGSAYIMLKRARPGSATPAQIGQMTQSPTAFVHDVDAHFKRTTSSGAMIVEELHETCYGERQYGVEDFEAHNWHFSSACPGCEP